MRCDKWFSLLLPFHFDSTNSYLTISIQIEEKKASFILGLIQRYDAKTSVNSKFLSVFPVTSTVINMILKDLIGSIDDAKNLYMK